MWLLLAAASSFAADTVLYVVRHAEKATAPAENPPLTEAGVARAAALSRLLTDVELKGVHSTDTARTRSTAQPVADGHHLPVAVYDEPEALLAEVRKAGGQHLVVGHSNTIARIVELAGGAPGPAVADTEFDRLYVVVLPDQGAPTTLRLHYGP